MEMKKQVLTFNEFVNEAYKMITESETFDDVKQKLSNLLNSDGRKVLGRLESLLKSNSTPIGNEDKMLNFVGDEFIELITNFDGKGTKIQSINVDVKNIKPIDMIQGSVFVSEMVDSSGMTGSTAEVKNGKVNLGDLLSTVNARNINLKAKNSPFKFNKKSGKFEKTPIKDGKRAGIFSGTGVDKQFIISDIGPAGIKFSEQLGKDFAPFFVDPDLEKIYTNPISLEGKKNIRKGKTIVGMPCCLVIYLLKQINTNGGNPTSIEKVDKVIKILKGGEESGSIDIQDDETLFERAKSLLKEEGKSYISNAILSQFTSVSSIEVIGGASKEGDSAFNKQLCQDRAKSVEVYLKTITTATITVSAQANIQPLESTEDLKTWRKVTLNITGTRISQSSPIEKVSYVARSAEFKPDSAVLSQVIFQFNVEEQD